MYCVLLLFHVRQASVCQSLVSLLFLMKRKKNTMGKAFEHRLTPNASEHEIFLMNLWIDLKYTDSCNLKLKATSYFYVLLSQ